MHRFLVLLIVFFLRCLAAADFDCAFVGSSPIPLFEALYQHHLGKKVLILEQAEECGGAWKAIDICGVPHADLGCHQIGSDANLKEFLETYGGCRIVSMDQPATQARPVSGNGYYFSQGCYELIRNLTQLIHAVGITLLTNHRLDSVFIDSSADCLVLKAQGKQFTVNKLFYTYMTAFQVENNKTAYSPHSTKYPHLYLLIQDPTPPKFSYMGYGGQGASRVMNLTHFTGLEGTGRQLIVFQVHGQDSLNNGQKYLDDLKNRNLVDKSAYILKSESYTYELSNANQGSFLSRYPSYFELLNASSFGTMSSYIGKWKKALRPYREILR